jgi:hypothetical protein
MDFNPESALIGGVSAFVIVLFLVQSIREAFNVAGRYIPLVAGSVGIGMMLATTYLPPDTLTGIAQGLVLAAAVSASVRYVKEAPNVTERPRTLQRHDAPTQRISTQRTQSTDAGTEQRYAGVRDLGETQSLPDLKEDERVGY